MLMSCLPNMSPTNTRGTLQILWSCLATLFLCTWTIQRLNVPSQSRPQSIQRSLRRFSTKSWWMLLTLLVPELIVGKALTDNRSAKSLLPHIKNFAEEDSVEWTITHCFLANMGWFMIHFPAELSEEPTVQNNISQEQRQESEPQVIQPTDGVRPIATANQGTSSPNTTIVTQDYPQDITSHIPQWVNEVRLPTTMNEVSPLLDTLGVRNGKLHVAGRSASNHTVDQHLSAHRTTPSHSTFNLESGPLVVEPRKIKSLLKKINREQSLPSLRILTPHENAAAQND